MRIITRRSLKKVINATCASEVRSVCGRIRETGTLKLKVTFLKWSHLPDKELDQKSPTLNPKALHPKTKLGAFIVIVGLGVVCSITDCSASILLLSLVFFFLLLLVVLPYSYYFACCYYCFSGRELSYRV